MSDQLPELALAIADPDRVWELLKQGTPVTAASLFAAIESWDSFRGEGHYGFFVKNWTHESLKLLLAAGADPNIRPNYADNNFSGVREGWASGEGSTNREFLRSRREWHALYRAAVPKLRTQKPHLSSLQATLLKHGADPYALFRQPLNRPRPFFAFPGVVQDENIEEKHAQHLFDSKDLEEHFKYNVFQLAGKETKFPNGEVVDYENDEYRRYPGAADRFGQYGVRSVIHALLEDGGFVKPILDFPGLDIEHRDPQGRTLVLSACRSALGADADVDGAMIDLAWDVIKGCYISYPFPPKRHPLARVPKGTVTTTLFQHFVNRGANLLAVDNYGKHALFHLLEAHEPEGNWRPPIVRKSVQFVAENVRQLVNQPDNAGNYPLHASLRRLRRFRRPNKYRDAAELEESVEDLLAAGADPKARDEFGNTALHYLTDDGLADRLRSDKQKRLFLMFLDLGVDINARNRAGRSAVELLLQDDGENLRAWEKEDGLAADVMGFLETLGARLTDQGRNGGTLLHIAAKNDSPKAIQMIRYLRGRGLDHRVRDGRGRTAVDVACELGNTNLVGLLEGWVR